MLLGCRVVRGPDWKWGDQDGGEGSVGTIVNLESHADGSKLPKQTVLVCWDNGRQSDYRAGLNGCCDLQILDSAPAGIRHSHFTCDSCKQNGIAGMRWHCLQCNDYDLCSDCYMNDCHDTNHEFERYDKPNDRSEGVSVGKRSEASHVQCKGLFPGAQVKKGRDWDDDCELNNMTGVVVGIKAWEGVPRSAVTVRWGDSLEMHHRVGYNGQVDLETVVPGRSLSYYKDHLPPAKLDKSHGTVSSEGEKLKEGDRVTIHLDADTLKSMAEDHGGWHPRMAKCIGEVGKVVKIDGDGDVQVKWKSQWFFHPGALVKIQILRPGDKVRVLSNKEMVMQYQDGHGGWNNDMKKILGEQGVVMGIDKDYDAIVSIGNKILLINPAALILESKKHERQPPGTAGIDYEELILGKLLGQNFMTKMPGLFSFGGSTEPVKKLYIAATLGNLDEVKEIIQKDKSLLNKRSGNDKTALHAACHQGHTEIVSYLLGQGADTEIKDEEGHTAMHHAAYGDKSGACVVLLLTANANVNAQDGETKTTPLHLAIQQENEKAVEALTDCQHCNINLQDKIGDTPLHQTIRDGRSKIAKTILDKCSETVDPCIFNHQGFNVFHLACKMNSIEIAKLLIDRYPVMVSMGKDDGFYPLHLAALNNHTEITKLLLESGDCNIDEVNTEGRTALSIAVAQSNGSVIELLIANKADLNKEDNDGDTPLHIAVMKHGMTSLPMAILNLINTSDTPITKEYIQAIAVFLVVKGADVNHRNHQGQTPLDLCISEDLRKVIEDVVRTAPWNPSTMATASPASEKVHKSAPASQKAPILQSYEDKQSPPPFKETSTPLQTETAQTPPITEMPPSPPITEDTLTPPSSEEAPSSSSTEEQTPSQWKEAPASPPAKEEPTPLPTKATQTPLPTEEEQTSKTKEVPTPPSTEATKTPFPIEATQTPLPNEEERTQQTKEVPTPPSTEATKTPFPTEATQTPLPTKEERTPSLTETAATPLPTQEEHASLQTEETSTPPPTLPSSETTPTTLPIKAVPTSQVLKKEETPSQSQVAVTASPNEAVSTSSTTGLLPSPSPPRKQALHAPYPPSRLSQSLSSYSSIEEIKSMLSPSEHVNIKPVERQTEAVEKQRNPVPTDDSGIGANVGANQYKENGAEGDKKSNREISSTIQISTKQVNSCRLCTHEEALVTFEPCNHKVLCQHCANRAQICVQCDRKIERKIAPDGMPYTGMTDFKKLYEKAKDDYEKEKQEKERVQKEKERVQKEKDELERETECQICMDELAKIVFRPCGHKACQQCSDKREVCHVCNKNIEEKVTTY